MTSAQFDVAIIGGGVAGLTAALSLDKSLRVGVFVKKSADQNTTVRAQGGIAAPMRADDSVDLHVADTLAAGGGLCNDSVVRQILRQAPAAVAWLSEMGVEFHRAPGGELSLGREGGHRRRRIAHVGDTTGRAIFSALFKAAQSRRNIVFYEHQMAINLSLEGGVCRGFYALNRRRRAVEAINAGAVVLACGGGGKVYLFSTTANDATGDGVAMAYRAGCRIANMEFVQFHPTCLYHPSAQNFLITEAMRGEGAKLVNAAGGQFIAHPDGELAARDIVARAIDGEMKRSGADCVYLDCSNRKRDFWRRRFPAVFQTCQLFNIHLPEDKVPVVPAAHYCCGGVLTDGDGKTDIAGLWAIGETACNGLHGANRLASNSLLEGVVTGRQCARALSPAAAAGALAEWDENRISPAAEAVMVSHNWEELRRLMSHYVGIVRTDERLRRARRRIEWIGEEIEDYYRRFAVTADFLELRSLAQCAELIVEGALARRESRGLHFNLDCQEQLPPAPTLLDKEMFAQRRRAINDVCPFSRQAIVAGAMTKYRGEWAGFCNSGCRDRFAAAVKNNFADADKELTAAKNFLDQQLAPN